MTELVLDRLSKRFGSFMAVDGVSLALAQGEFVSLLGPSGCGKTTTLRMIAGFIEPTGGSVSLDGEVLSSPEGALPPEKRRMSMIFQSYAIWPHMTVFDNVAFGLKVRRAPAAEIRRRVGEMLDVVQLGALAARYPNELSGGQQQRVALARAIVVQPQVLLLDEPLSNLDANLREEMRGEIRRLHDEFRITTVYVTHDQAEAMAMSDRIAVMNHGRIEQLDAPYAVYTRPRTRFVAGFIGTTNYLERQQGAGDPFAAAALPASLRPQHIQLHAQPPNGGAGGRIVLAGRIVERTFLGAAWDYIVALDAGTRRLRVAAPAAAVHEGGAAVWLEVDPADIVPVQAASAVQ